MLTKTASQWTTEFDKAIKVLQDTKNAIRGNNNSNDIRNYRIAMAMLSSVPETLEIEVDGVAVNYKQSDYEIGNLGDLAECILRWHRMTRKPSHIAVRSCGKYDSGKDEIKSAMSCRWMATRSPKRQTILMNKCGIFKLTGKEVAQEVDERGRLPYNRVVGVQDDECVYLETMLGLW